MKSPHFIFYAGEELDFIERVKVITRKWFKDIESFECPGFVLLAPQDFIKQFIIINDHFICAITGWARSLSTPPVDYQFPESFQPHLFQVAHAILNGWPLTSQDITGNFSGVLYQKASHYVEIFSDPASIYPIYYTTFPSGLVGGTHLLLLNQIVRRNIDLVGVVERLSSPEFVNFGSRTIFQEIKRVLPGELVRWDRYKNIQKVFDNTLFKSSMNKFDIRDLAQIVWNDYKTDIHACIGKTARVNLGLSGGWDSRLIAAALRGNNVRCYTHGTQEDEYEVLLAKHIAKILPAEFIYCDFSSEWAPSRERFIKNILSTEATYITEWLAVLDRFDSHTFEPFMLGDMFEAVAGRYMRRLSSRSGRKRLYVQRTLGRDKLPTQKRGDFENWRDNQMEANRSNVFVAASRLNPELFNNRELSEIQGEIDSDMSEVFFRISSHDLIFVDTFDELLNWYLRCINGVSKQVITLNEEFFGLNPTMSFRSLRMISGIHPFSRVSGQLMYHIQRLPELSAFSRIPSANAPFIPSSYPLWISDLIWAGRSTVDQWLIRRAIKARNAKARFRLMKTFNLVQLYNMPSASTNVESWFSGEFINPDAYLDIFNRRAQMQSWPLCNYDITSPASLSLMLDLIDYESY